MKTTDEMLADLRAALAHNEQEAMRLRAAIAALSGAAHAPAPMPTFVPWPSFPVWPPPGVPVYIGDPPPWQAPVTITCGAVGLALCVTRLHS